MRHLKVKDLLPISTTTPSVVKAHATLREVVEKILEDPGTREVYVLDDENCLYGVITLRRLARRVFSEEVPDFVSPMAMLQLISDKTAIDFALHKPTFVHKEDPLNTLLSVMFRYDLNEIPVVDDHRRIVGNLNMLEVLSAWLSGKLDKL